MLDRALNDFEVSEAVGQGGVVHRREAWLLLSPLRAPADPPRLLIPLACSRSWPAPPPLPPQVRPDRFAVVAERKAKDFANMRWVGG